MLVVLSGNKIYFSHTRFVFQKFHKFRRRKTPEFSTGRSQWEKKGLVDKWDNEALDQPKLSRKKNDFFFSSVFSPLLSLFVLTMRQKKRRKKSEREVSVSLFVQK